MRLRDGSRTVDSAVDKFVTAHGVSLQPAGRGLMLTNAAQSTRNRRSRQHLRCLLPKTPAPAADNGLGDERHPDISC
jgi:hypothetical protein